MTTGGADPGGRPSSGGMGVGGRDGGASGAAGLRLDAGMDAPATDASAGTSGRDASEGDGATDAGREASAADGGDWLAAHAPPCSLPASFSELPTGTYVLDLIVTSESTEVAFNVHDDCFASTDHQLVTLTLTESWGPDVVDATVDSPNPWQSGGERSVSLHREDPAVFVIHGASNLDLPDEMRFTAEIDRRTGIVTSFDFTSTHFSPDGSTTRSLGTGAGWPRCAATDAQPPTWVRQPAPPAIYYTCGLSSSGAVGCSYSYDDYYPPYPASRCAEQRQDACAVSTCTDTPEGYRWKCCN